MSNYKSKWWRWPEDKRKGRPPWFVILRRMIFLPILLLGLGLGWLAILGSDGLREANKWFNAAIYE